MTCGPAHRIGEDPESRSTDSGGHRLIPDCPPASQSIRAWAAETAASLPPLTESQVAAVARLAARLDAAAKREPAA